MHSPSFIEINNHIINTNQIKCITPLPNNQLLFYFITNNDTLTIPFSSPIERDNAFNFICNEALPNLIAFDPKDEY